MKKVSIYLLMLVLSSLTFNAFAKKAGTPNIVFIFADDQCYDAVAAFGINDEVKTPNLDRLVNGGVTFTHAFNMGAWNGAVCVASRAMFNTGRYVWNARPCDDKERMTQLCEDGKMWGPLMKSAGYDTYMTGKWHVKVDPKKAFDQVLHDRVGMPKQTKQGYNRPLSEADTTWKPWKKEFGGYWKGGKHWSELLCDDALGYIAQAKEKETPFFMYLAFSAPHDPRQSPKEYVDMYPLENVSVPESFLPEYPYNEEMGCPRTLRDEKLAPFPRTEYSIKVNRQEYYAIITHMDHQIGRILDAIEASGKADNTYIFFTADHGLSVGNHGLVGKQNMYDHSVRVPLMVVGPKVKKGKRIDTPVYLQDIMASSLDLAGVAKPDYVEFNSLMPMVFGKQKNANNTAIYGCFLSKQRMIRTEDYKLIMYPKANVVRLYDMKNDPKELKDLAPDTAYKATIVELINQFKTMQVEYNDDLDLTDLFATYL
ncbi:sulfatase-like hydrolase/transferase [bacterium]|nr:sulfatase-like hydrolase/transferase [bacterium]